MTMEITDTMSEQETESKLWTEYQVMLARQQAAWQLGREAFRQWVMTRGNDSNAWDVYMKCAELHDMWREREKEAYVAWKRIAYPMYDIPLRDEDRASS